MTDDARQVLEELLAARNERSPERAAAALADDARYWDPDRGEVAGRDAVAGALTDLDARLGAETVAVAGDDAVVEVQVQERGRTFRSTEVYRLTSGRIASIRAYFDPFARGA
jgi:ketosteroid isomerase-like protein